MNEAKRKNILFAVIAVVIAVVFFFAGFGTGFGVGKGAADAPDADAGAADMDGGMLLSSDDDTDRGVSLTSVKIAREAYDDYDIMPIAQTAYTVTATVSGDGLTEEQKGVTWGEAVFKDPSSEWATGKNVSDYVTTSPNGNKLTVQCLQAFGEQIIIKCSSSFNPNVSKDLKVDYKVKSCFHIRIAYGQYDQMGGWFSHDTIYYEADLVGSNSTMPIDFRWYQYYDFEGRFGFTEGTVPYDGDLADYSMSSISISMTASNNTLGFLSRHAYDSSGAGRLSCYSVSNRGLISQPVISFGDEVLTTIFGKQAAEHYGADLSYVLGHYPDDLSYFGGKAYAVLSLSATLMKYDSGSNDTKSISYTLSLPIATDSLGKYSNFEAYKGS